MSIIYIITSVTKGCYIMPVVNRKDNAININTIEQQIDDVIKTYFDKFNINIYDMNAQKLISHNLLTAAFTEVYKQLFKPSKGMVNNQRSIIDYNDIELLTVIANKYIDICLLLNKSLGLMPFSLFTGIHVTTLMTWRDHPESNPARTKVIKHIVECHKMEQIGLLNGSPVGALAVANNDIETGLEWSKQNAQQIASNTVYILPSERVDKLRITKEQE